MGFGQEGHPKYIIGQQLIVCCVVWCNDCLVDSRASDEVSFVTGVGNMPDGDAHKWLPWLREQRAGGLQVYLSTQCTNGALQPELYRSGSVAIDMVCLSKLTGYPLFASHIANIAMVRSR